MCIEQRNIDGDKTELMNSLQLKQGQCYLRNRQRSVNPNNGWSGPNPELITNDAATQNPIAFYECTSNDDVVITTEKKKDTMVGYVDAAFRQVKPGEAAFFVWRIEKLEVRPVPKDHYGQFYDGDAYLIYSATKQVSKH